MPDNSLLQEIKSKLESIANTRSELQQLRKQLLAALAKVNEELGIAERAVARPLKKAGAKRTKRGAVADAILGAIEGEMKPKEVISKLASLNPSSIRQTLPKLVKDGKLKHNKKSQTYRKA